MRNTTVEQISLRDIIFKYIHIQAYIRNQFLMV